MSMKKFLHEERGSVSVEYVILVAIAAALLGLGVNAMFGALSNLFAAWAGYFGAGS
jgi:Flp pilus assembly pilin Flp